MTEKFKKSRFFFLNQELCVGVNRFEKKTVSLNRHPPILFHLMSKEHGVKYYRDRRSFSGDEIRKTLFENRV